MKYLVESVSKNIIDNAPLASGEALVRVDGFEKIEIYIYIFKYIVFIIIFIFL